MKILILTHNIIEDDNSFRCYQLGRCLGKKGHKVTLLTGSRSSRFFPLRFCPLIEYRDGVRVIQMPRSISKLRLVGEWDGVDILYRIFHIIGNYYDVIIAFDHRSNVSLPFYVAKALRRGKTTFIVDWADWWTNGGILEGLRRSPRLRLSLTYPLERFWELDTKRKADGVTVISTVLRDRAISIGVPEERLLLLPGGANVDAIKPLPKIEARQRLGISPEAKVVSLIGSGIGWEQYTLFPHFEKVTSEVGNVIYLFTGPKDPKKEELARSYGLEGKVVQMGFVPYEEFIQVLACTDIFVIPLPQESLNSKARWPNKVGDYMAAGRPTVVNAVGDVERLVREDNIGLLAKPDMSDFAEKIILLLKNPDLAQSLGHNARKAAEEKYSWAIMAQKLEEFLLDIRERKGRRIQAK